MKIKGKELGHIQDVRYLLDGVQCDICNKVIRYTPDDDSGNRYHSVMIKCDDSEYKKLDICPDCIMTFIEDYMRDNMNKDTLYIHLTTERLYKDQQITEKKEYRAEY